ncbi:MAG: hypothetical protein JXA91_04545 [Candidatus Thermoplasmatota archaeon]|nr:hypothetical protein [Candidatus Thermoplasmatota archaeon]
MGIQRHKRIEFLSYRYFVIETQQRSLLQDLNDKVALFRGIFTSLRENKKFDILLKGKKYLLYHYKDVTQKVLITKFAKCKSVPHYEPREEDIIKVKSEDFPFIYVIFDLEGQSILVQNNTTLFASTNSAIKVLENYFTEIMMVNHFTVKITEVTHSSKFWETVEDADKIYSLRLNLKSPNLFGGQIKANELLKNQRDLFNNTEFNVELKNENGELKVLKENVSDYIHYISAGGGQYAMAFQKNGIVQKIKSIFNIKKYFLRNPDDEAFDELLETIKELKDFNKES